MTQFLDQTSLPKASAFPRALACLNALTHGGTSEKTFIPGEDPALFDTLMDEAFELYQPASTADAALVTDSVNARWTLWRRQRAHLNLEHTLHSRADTAVWSPGDYHSIELVDRYKTQAERALHRALTNVNAIRKDEFQRERWREYLALQKERVALKREEFELTKAKDARLAPKQEAEGLRDAVLAKNEVAGMEQRRADHASAEKIEADLNAKLAPIQYSEQLNCHIIKQIITLECYDDGSAYIDYLHPDHDDVRDIIQNLDQYQVPPQCVVRTFNFSTYIPSEYSFLRDLGHKRPVTGNFTFNHTFDFDTFIELAEKERQILANQPEVEDEDDDENQ
jgi:hypothetical protein